MWTEPKTDWKNGEYFNLDVDYARIKGNILYIAEFAEKLNKTFNVELSEYTIEELPYEEFFNNIVYAVEEIEKAYPIVYDDMRNYQENNVIWDENDLNTIEKNTKKVYNLLIGERNCISKLDFMLGVDEL
jgi:hypothetical protein